jgi:hypothetical protein
MRQTPANSFICHLTPITAGKQHNITLLLPSTIPGARYIQNINAKFSAEQTPCIATIYRALQNVPIPPFQFSLEPKPINALEAPNNTLGTIAITDDASLYIPGPIKIESGDALFLILIAPKDQNILSAITFETYFQ